MRYRGFLDAIAAGEHDVALAWADLLDELGYDRMARRLRRRYEKMLAEQAELEKQAMQRRDLIMKTQIGPIIDVVTRLGGTVQADVILSLSDPSIAARFVRYCRSLCQRLEKRER